MKKKEIIIVIGIVIAAAILVGVGFIFLQTNYNDKKETTTKTTSKEKLKVKEIKEEHCYQDLCINSLIVAHIDKNKEGNVNFHLVNKEDSVVPEATMKIVFDNGIEKEFSHTILEPKEEVWISLNYENDELKDVKDYKILPNGS